MGWCAFCVPSAGLCSLSAQGELEAVERLRHTHIHPQAQDGDRQELRQTGRGMTSYPRYWAPAQGPAALQLSRRPLVATWPGQPRPWLMGTQVASQPCVGTLLPCRRACLWAVRWL